MRRKGGLRMADARMRERGVEGYLLPAKACIAARRLPCDCRQMRVLRAFAGRWLAQTKGGCEEIAFCVDVAFELVARIRALQNADDFFDELYATMVAPCVSAIEEGKYEYARMTYRVKLLEMRDRLAQR